MTRDYSSILFTPEQISQQTTEYLQDRRDNKDLGITIGLPELDKKFLPLWPGELCAIVARPGNGKTGVMVHWARERSKQLKTHGKGEGRAVVYVTLEQSVEELNAFNIAADEQIGITSMARGDITDEQWARCLRSAVNRIMLPLWNIGYSSVAKAKQTAIDLDAIGGALALIRDMHGKKIDMVFVDYLQRIPIRGVEKPVGVSDNLDGLKNLALQLRCPVVVGVQAKREVDEYPDHTPELDDGQWTSNIEQTSDRVITLMRPAKYWQVGEQVDTVEKLRNMPIARNMMVMYIAKQKLAEDNFSHLAYFDPVYNKLDELETRNVR